MRIKDAAGSYADRPCYGELVAVVLAGATHVLSELWLSAVISLLFNVGVSIGSGLEVTVEEETT